MVLTGPTRHVLTTVILFNPHVALRTGFRMHSNPSATDSLGVGVFGLEPLVITTRYGTVRFVVTAANTKGRIRTNVARPRILLVEDVGGWNHHDTFTTTGAPLKQGIGGTETVELKGLVFLVECRVVVVVIDKKLLEFVVRHLFRTRGQGTGCRLRCILQDGVGTKLGPTIGTKSVSTRHGIE